jgi:hypothetical protein
MSIYDSLLLCHHNFDFVVLNIQFLVGKKINYNIMTGSLLFNFKHAYQGDSVCPFLSSSLELV